MIFLKKSRWNMIFLVLSRKTIFLFPENMILPFGRKMKNDFSQKNTWKYDILFGCFGTIIFPKRPHWSMTFLVLSEQIALVFPETRYFFFAWKIHGDTIFSVYTCRHYKRGVRPLRQ